MFALEVPLGDFRLQSRFFRTIPDDRQVRIGHMRNQPGHRFDGDVHALPV